MDLGLGWRQVSACASVRGAVVKRSAASIVVLVTGLLVSVVPVAWAVPGDTTLVSRASGATGVVGNGPSAFPAISGDGRVVAFASLSSNLTADDRDRQGDVFVRDVVANATMLVSRASGVAGVKGNGNSDDAAISGDGSRVAFASRATNLTGSDRDRAPDVFVRDLRSKTTTLVSRAGGRAGPKANARASQPAISANGRFVAFISRASNLTSDDRDHRVDVFVRDLRAHTTILVNRASGPAGRKCRTAQPFATPTVSADGRLVAFVCSGPGRSSQIFVRDLRLQTTTLISRADGIEGAIGDSSSIAPAISADGRIVAFQSAATNLVADGLNTPPDYNVFVRDLAAATTTLASQPSGASGAPGNSNRDGHIVERPSPSSDGRLVAFQSYSTTLTPDDPDDTADVLVRDRAAATTTLVSRATGSQGAKVDGQSGEPAMSADGRFVAFGSAATNLTSNRVGAAYNVFVREL
jgi:Tol biopolymer transport system component